MTQPFDPRLALLSDPESPQARGFEHLLHRLRRAGRSPRDCRNERARRRGQVDDRGQPRARHRIRALGSSAGLGGESSGTRAFADVRVPSAGLLLRPTDGAHARGPLRRHTRGQCGLLLPGHRPRKCSPLVCASTGPGPVAHRARDSPAPARVRLRHHRHASRPRLAGREPVERRRRRDSVAARARRSRARHLEKLLDQFHPAPILGVALLDAPRTAQA